MDVLGCLPNYVIIRQNECTRNNLLCKIENDITYGYHYTFMSVNITNGRNMEISMINILPDTKELDSQALDKDQIPDKPE